MSATHISDNKILAWLGVKTWEKGSTMRELMAAVVVFLVALPLCMGVAIASGVPPALGLWTGIVGGIVVGLFAGCRLQVSGPAAGLAVIVYDLVQTHGLPMLGWIVLFGGILQLVAGFLKLGQWFRAVSPAVIRGMLSGIGVLIFASQFHVMVDDKPRPTSLENLLSIPEALYKGVMPVDGSAHHMAALVGLVTISVIIGWTLFHPKKLKMVPGALLGVIAACLLANLAKFPINFIKPPENLIDSANWIPFASASSAFTPSIFIAACTLAVVASAETLLCATAVDQLHDGPRTDYDQELKSQGIGNILCGFLGALPMTGVIVRSSANVDAGAKTRISAVVHGLMLLIFVAALPFVLGLIPTAALAAILVFTGYKLFNPKEVYKMWQFDRGEFAIFALTISGIVGIDLLSGIALGIAAALVRLAWRLTRLEVDISGQDATDGSPVIVHLRGTATFLTLPKLAQALEKVPTQRVVHLELAELGYIDHACIEMLGTWEKSRASQGNKLVVIWDDLLQRYKKAQDPETTVIRFDNPNRDETTSPPIDPNATPTPA